MRRTFLIGPTWKTWSEASLPALLTPMELYNTWVTMDAKDGDDLMADTGRMDTDAMTEVQEESLKATLARLISRG